MLYLTGGVFSGLRTAANAIVNPFSWTVNEVARPIGHFFAGAMNYSDVVAQNQKLRYELGKAQQQANERGRSNGNSQQLTHAAPRPLRRVRCPRSRAQVTALSPTNFAATVDISMGRDNGLLAGMPVVANGGLVGQHHRRRRPTAPRFD